MPILLHGTYDENLNSILYEGLKLPTKTGLKQFNCSRKDRICFVIKERDIPTTEVKEGIIPANNNSMIRIWWGRPWGVIIDPDYLAENTDLFRYENLGTTYRHERRRSEYIKKEILELGLKEAENKNGHAIAGEIIAIKDIPIEGIAALIDNKSLELDKLKQIAQKAPAHIQIHSLTEYDQYERIK